MQPTATPRQVVPAADFQMEYFFSVIHLICLRNLLRGQWVYEATILMCWWVHPWDAHYRKRIWNCVCVRVCVGDQRYHYRASSDHLLRLHLSGQTSILDPHARRCLLSAAVRYVGLSLNFSRSSQPGRLRDPSMELPARMQTFWLSDLFILSAPQCRVSVMYDCGVVAAPPHMLYPSISISVKASPAVCYMCKRTTLGNVPTQFCKRLQWQHALSSHLIKCTLLVVGWAPLSPSGAAIILHGIDSTDFVHVDLMASHS